MNFSHSTGVALSIYWPILLQVHLLFIFSCWICKSAWHVVRLLPLNFRTCTSPYNIWTLCARIWNDDLADNEQLEKESNSIDGYLPRYRRGTRSFNKNLSLECSCPRNEARTMKKGKGEKKSNIKNKQKGPEHFHVTWTATQVQWLCLDGVKMDAKSHITHCSTL